MDVYGLLFALLETQHHFGKSVCQNTLKSAALLEVDLLRVFSVMLREILDA